jgi:signal transduction histidine kinase
LSPVETREAITSLAQELRQPMSSIIGYTDLLLSESTGILGALQRKFLERVRVSTERIGALVEDLIQVTALDSGSSALAPRPIDLYEVIQETVGQTGAQIQAKELDLRLDLPENLPHLHADRDAIQQALLHLLQNAVSATPEQGQVSLRAHFESSPDQPDYVLIQVADQGGGIPPEDLSRVFSRLYRADNVLIQGVGDTGVGLSIVKQLVEAHGGRVWVDTDLGQGSIFSLLLPVDDTALHASRDVDRRGEPAA